MGSEYNVCAGTFLEVPNSKIKVFLEESKCPVCHKKVDSAYCPDCGVKVCIEKTEQEEILNLWDILEEEEIEDDYFLIEREDSVMVLLNKETEMQKELDTYNSTDFIEMLTDSSSIEYHSLIEVLKKRNIQYNFVVGVFGYYY